MLHDDDDDDDGQPAALYDGRQRVCLMRFMLTVKLCSYHHRLLRYRGSTDG